MLTTAESLLASILAAPDDDGPRLVYADWLDENGQGERAAMLRGHVTRRLGPFVSNVGRAITFTYSPEIDFYVQAADTGPVVIAPAIPDATWVVRRGMVSEIRCPLAAWMGVCQAEGPHHHGDRCDGGRVQSPNAQFTQDCRRCKGTGRAPGAAAVAAREPVTVVRLTCREPYVGGKGRHSWVELDNWQTVPFGLPPAMFKCLHTSRYPDRAKAVDALSRAALRWARGQGPA